MLPGEKMITVNIDAEATDEEITKDVKVFYKGKEISAKVRAMELIFESEDIGVNELLDDLLLNEM